MNKIAVVADSTTRECKENGWMEEAALEAAYWEWRMGRERWPVGRIVEAGRALLKAKIERKSKINKRGSKG